MSEDFGTRPCAIRGVVVQRAKSDVPIVAYGEERRVRPGTVVLINDVKITFQMTRCDACEARMWRAAWLVEEYPAFARRLGAKEFAMERVEDALAALAALGVDSERVDHLTATVNDVARLVRLLAGPGGASQWASRLLPFVPIDVDMRPSPRPWMHVTEGQWQTLRNGFGRLLFERMGGSRTVAPPADSELRGCLLCGVGAIESRDDDPEEAWGRLRKANPRTLGGKAQPDGISGYCCPECAAQVDAVGALGPTAMERSLIAFLGVPHSGINEVRLENVRAWCALPKGTPPNDTPWAHEPDHEGIRRVIASA